MLVAVSSRLVRVASRRRLSSRSLMLKDFSKRSPSLLHATVWEPADVTWSSSRKVIKPRLPPPTSSTGWLVLEAGGGGGALRQLVFRRGRNGAAQGAVSRQGAGG